MAAAYDPKLHLFVANVNNLFQPMQVVQRPDGSFVNQDRCRRAPLLGSRQAAALRAHALGPAGGGECGYRRHRLSQDPGRHRAFPGGHAGHRPPRPGGTILTASGLTFVGATDDFRFRAFATATGEKLWEIKLASSVETTPVTYQGADGRQFVTVVDTGGSQTGSAVTNDEIIAFALPKK